jgi:hypothetical protein
MGASVTGIGFKMGGSRGFPALPNRDSIAGTAVYGTFAIGTVFAIWLPRDGAVLIARV